jgi:hypothetical protein
VIYKSSPLPPNLIGNELQRRFLPRFRVFDENAVWEMESPGMVGDDGYLTGGVYMEYTQWNAPACTITGSLRGPASTLILGAPSADYMRGVIGGWDITRIPLLSGAKRRIFKDNSANYLLANHAAAGGPNDVAIEETLAPGETGPALFDQRIFIFDFPEVPGGAFSITLSGGSPITLSKLWIGVPTELLPCSKYEVNTIMDGAGAWTDLGVAYGHKRTGRREIACSWELHEDGERRRIERYIERAQNVQAHFVEPCDKHEYIPPLFAVLESKGFEGEIKAPGWFWGGQTLKYREAK